MHQSSLSQHIKDIHGLKVKPTSGRSIDADPDFSSRNNFGKVVARNKTRDIEPINGERKVNKSTDVIETIRSKFQNRVSIERVSGSKNRAADDVTTAGVKNGAKSGGKPGAKPKPTVHPTVKSGLKPSVKPSAQTGKKPGAKASDAKPASKVTKSGSAVKTFNCKSCLHEFESQALLDLHQYFIHDLCDDVDTLRRGYTNSVAQASKGQQPHERKDVGDKVDEVKNYL